MLKLSTSERQAQTPEKGTLFETAEIAHHAAEKLLGINGDKNWRVHQTKVKSEEFYVIKFWPKGSPQICEERRWVVIIKPQKRKKIYGTENE